MKDIAALRAEISRLRELAYGAADSRAVAAISELIRALERYADEPETGHDGKMVI